MCDRSHIHACLKAQLQPHQYYAHPALTRYFDHIQSRPTVRKAADSFSPNFARVTFDLDNMPRAERKADPPKKKEKAGSAAAPDAQTKTTPADSPAASTAKEQTEPKREKKEKQEAKGKGKQAAAASESGAGKKAGVGKAAAPAEDAGEPVPSMIDLRVGHIVDGTRKSLQLTRHSLFARSHETSRCRWPLRRGLFHPYFDAQVTEPTTNSKSTSGKK